MVSVEKKEKPSTKKIINYCISAIFTIVFIVVLILFVYIFAQVAAGKSPTLFGYRFYYILTDSMSPTIEPKQVIISKVIKNKDKDSIDELVNEGDIITFSTSISSGKTVPNTHRVIKDVYYDEAKDGYYLQTKGDNPYASKDSPIPIENVQAVMKGTVPAVSSIYNAVTSRVGMILFLGIPCTAILAALIYKLVVIIKTPAKTQNEKTADYDLEKRKKEIAKKAVEDYIKQQNTDRNE